MDRDVFETHLVLFERVTEPSKEYSLLNFRPTETGHLVSYCEEGAYYTYIYVIYPEKAKRPVLLRKGRPWRDYI